MSKSPSILDRRDDRVLRSELDEDERESEGVCSSGMDSMGHGVIASSL